jgi:hypothetical protein
MIETSLTSLILTLIGTQNHNTSLLLFEFEELFAVATGFVILLMYLFYIKYPYNKDVE